MRNQITEERGVWYIEQPTTGVIRYKFDKTEDCNRRRMRMKVDKQASKTQYFTKEAYEQEKYKKSSTASEVSDTMSMESLSLNFQSPESVGSRSNLIDQLLHSRDVFE